MVVDMFPHGYDVAGPDFVCQLPNKSSFSLLAVALASRGDIAMTWHEITNEEQAIRLGMHGSPTMPVNGQDPFLHPGETAGISCRIFRGVGDTPVGLAG
jgi:2-hydroxychromene-2-carboxylate isomerase